MAVMYYFQLIWLIKIRQKLLVSDTVAITGEINAFCNCACFRVKKIVRV
jgi:hypothetical protein